MSEGRVRTLAGRELAVLLGVQSALSGRPPVVRVARALSLFGEHGAGWFAL
ncbi:MAG TPA: phosphatase PAP2 family protein, partial [Pseudonocardiaceae bacterium]|nr:phosphatase PAP2 family protein [Pseudonocardiaceae bacterium]